VYHEAGLADAVTWSLSPGIRGPEHTHAGFKCVDEPNCDAETYFLCAQAAGGSVDFLACMDAAPEPFKASIAEKCAAQGENGKALSWSNITSCFTGSQGATLKKNAALYFDELFPSPVGIPHIEINGKQQMDRSAASLLKALCATGISAGACKGSLTTADSPTNATAELRIDVI